MFYVDKCVFSASNEDYGTGDLVNNTNWFQFSQVKVGILNFPYLIFDVLLYGADNVVHKEGRQKGQVVITKLVDEDVKVRIRIIRDNSSDSSKLSSIEDSRCSSHAPSPEEYVLYSIFEPDAIDYGIYILPLVVAKSDKLTFRVTASGEVKGYHIVVR